MALHLLTSITIGVPDVAATAAYYEDFGLTPTRGGRFATADGGEQLALVAAARRRLVELGVGVDDADDLERAAANLARVGERVEREASSVTTVDPGTQVRVVLRIAERLRQAAPAAPATNGPGHAGRAPGPRRCSARVPCGLASWGTSCSGRRTWGPASASSSRE